MGAAAFALPHLITGRPSDLAGDYWVFYSAARVVAHGGDPYRQAVLDLAERRVWPGVAPPPAAANFAYLPIVAWLLIPLARLPFWPSYAVVTLADAVLTGLALAALARRLEWRHPVVPALLGVCLWVSLASLVLGQPDGLLVAGLVAALLLRLSGRGIAAGLLLTLTWCKPQLLLPAAPLLALSCWPDRRLGLRVLAGFGLGTGAGLALQLAAMPGLLASWWGYLHRFAGAVPRLQGDLAGIAGLRADLPVRVTAAAAGWTAAATAIAGVAVVAAISVALARRRARGVGGSPGAVALAVLAPLAVWLLATPYDHVEDLLLLTPLVVVLLGPGAARLDRPSGWGPAMLLLTLPYVQALRDGVPDLAPLVVLVACLAGVGTALRSPRRAPLPAGTIGVDVPSAARGPAP